MKYEELWHLVWIYNRMVFKHNENKHTDYMLKFRTIIDKLIQKEFPFLLTMSDDKGILRFEFHGEQP